MQYYAIINQGMEKLAKQEIFELINVEGTIKNQIVEFSTEKKEDVITLLQYGQSFYRLLLKAGESLDENIDFEENGWKNCFSENISFRIEVEHVKGQENRQRIAKNTAAKIFEEISIKPELKLKDPEMLFVVFFNGERYCAGVDLYGKELTSRRYRVFPHQASFKGDLGYSIIRDSGFISGEKLLVGFCKDGVLAIEAALYVNMLPVREEAYWKKFPLFQDVKATYKEKGNTIIDVFDESMQNITAVRKNSKITGVSDFLKIYKYSLDELDLKYGQDAFDRIIFHVTAKDEEKINELYYQTNYILKSKGVMVLVGRRNWELSISDNFVLKEKQEIIRGNSVQIVWVLEKR